MLWLYDNAIADDLRESFNSDENGNAPFVKVIDPDVGIPLAAQLQNDQIHFPVVCVVRSPDYQIDTSLSNFTAMHKGSLAGYDSNTNELYYEKSIPIELKYTITILHTNTTDIDEIVRELLFKYNDMYFLTIKAPYEAKRKIRFGFEYDRNDTIDRNSGFLEALSEGKLYSTQIPFRCVGARLITYTPKQLRRVEYDVEPYTQSQMDIAKTRPDY